MQPKPESRRLKPKLNRRQRRRLRDTPSYQEIQKCFGTSDAHTMLLLRIGDLHTAEAGESITGHSWARSHIIVGLSARLKVGASVEVNGPWQVSSRDHGVEITISEPGQIMFIDRRHWQLVDAILAGTVEPVSPIAEAISQRPVSQRMPRPRLKLVSTNAGHQVQN